MSNATVTRDQLLREFQKSPESAPRMPTSGERAYSAKPYRFDTQLALFPGLTAQELIAQASLDADEVKPGLTALLVKGLITVLVGVVAGCAALLFLPLFLFALPCFYFGMDWARTGGGQRLRAQYDQRFIDDVKRYASQTQI